MTASDVVPRASASEPKWSPVVELRQYTLHPGMRDVLIDLFEREFIESQEAVGITVIGQFRDLDDPNRFVWLRGFRDMTARAQSLQAFYGGRIWKQHRDAANATMADSDDVLLLRPATARSGFSPVGSERPPRGVPRAHAGLVVAGIHSLETLPASAFIDYVEHELTRALTDSGGVVLACLVTDNSPNDFPALPVREGEDVFVWFAGFADATPLEGTTRDRGAFRTLIPDAPGARRPMQVLRLLPTWRSALTGLSGGLETGAYRAGQPCWRRDPAR